jgi:WS/DGAT/MGAT family acyltransferase
VDPPIPIGLPHWEDDPDFDIQRHMIRARLPEPGDDAALQAYLEEQIHRPFDRQHPLWEYHFIDGYRDGCAVMPRFHHALGDGAALMEVLLSTTDAEPDDDLLPEPKKAPARDHGADHEHHGLLGAASWMASAAGSAARGALHLLGELPHLANAHTLVDALTVTQQTGQITGKLLLGANPHSPLTGIPGLRKRVVWSEARGLDEIKKAGRLAGATMNDVLVTALSEALATYVEDRGGDAVDLITMIPVNLRKPGEPLPRELGNKFALVFLELPSGQYAPLERLALAKTRMDDIKHSPYALITFGLISAIGRTNPDVERVLVDFFSNKAIGVTTNVPGPRSRRYMAGVPMTGLLGWVPGSGHQTLGACILTYDNTVRVGFKVDAEIVPDPEKLVHAFDEAIDDLLQITGSHGHNHH